MMMMTTRSPAFFFTTHPKTQNKYLCGLIRPKYPFPTNNLSHSLPSLSLPSSLSLKTFPSCSSSHSESASTSSLSAMENPSKASSHTEDDDEVAYDISPIMKVYKNGRVQRLAGEDFAPPGLDSTTGVESKDVVISQNDGVSARVFIPKITNPDLKLPLFIYFHGGAFCIESPFSPNYHNNLISVVSQANVIGVSVRYRRAPEHPVPAAHEDAWTALKWIVSHSDEWLNRHADFGKAFFAGDSAGANIAHHMAIRVGLEPLPGLNLKGIILVHPYFWGVDRIGSEANRPEDAVKVEKLWRFSCPTTTGLDDPIINPEKDPNVGRIGCGRVLVCVAENDLLKDRGWNYKKVLEKNGFEGEVEVMETKDEEHVFHMFKPTCENALAMLAHIVSFINRD